MLFLEELQLKAPEKKEAFFKSLINAAPSFPVGSLQFKVIPLVTQAISFESKSVNAANVAAASGQPPPTPASVNVLLAMLDSILVADHTVKATNANSPNVTTAAVRGQIDMAVIDLFACNDRIVRVGLLQRIEKLAPAISNETVNNCFDQICTGFSDATPVVRELTIKAMIHIVQRLNDTNKNDKLVRFLAKLQTDPEHAIRTNCVVCLGLIAPHLSAEVRRKTLTASFARAMKDPFVHARAAGLRGLISSHKLMGLDKETLATKIMPTICPLLVDSAKDVRVLAFEAMSALTKTLQEELKAAEAATVPSGSASAAPASSGETASTSDKSSEGFLGMAVSFAASFAGSKTNSANPVVATPSGTNNAALANQRPIASNTTQSARPLSIGSNKSPSKASTNWDEDDATDMSGNLMQEEDDPDDFFMKQPVKQPTFPKAPTSSVPVNDIFSNNGAIVSKPKPIRLAKKQSTEKPVLDLLSDEDMDLFTPKPIQPTKSVHSPASLPIKQTPVPPTSAPKSTIPADDTDFFASLMTAPPSKRKT
jgi:hypothetical protein